MFAKIGSLTFTQICVNVRENKNGYDNSWEKHELQRAIQSWMSLIFITKNAENIYLNL